MRRLARAESNRARRENIADSCRERSPRSFVEESLRERLSDRKKKKGERKREEKRDGMLRVTLRLTSTSSEISVYSVDDEPRFGSIVTSALLYTYIYLSFSLSFALPLLLSVFRSVRLGLILD